MDTGTAYCTVLLARMQKVWLFRGSCLSRYFQRLLYDLPLESFGNTTFWLILCAVGFMIYSLSVLIYVIEIVQKSIPVCVFTRSCYVTIG